MASYRCVVPGCDGVIRSDRPSEAPCPECVKRVTLVATLRERLKAVEAQLLQVQAKRIRRYVPTLQALAKKPMTAAEIAKATGLAATSVATSCAKMERLGLITIAEFRRGDKSITGVAVWSITSVAERALQEIPAEAAKAKKTKKAA